MAVPVVIFGAGASYDVIDIQLTRAENISWRPPLTKDIFASDGRPFDGILKQYPSFNPWVNDIRARIQKGEALESILNEYYKGSKDGISLIRLQSLKHYLSELFLSVSKGYLSTGNSYSTMIEFLRLQYPEVCVLSFNYDLLLDRAIEECFLLKLNKIHDYHTNPKFKLIKLHGSCNWWQEYVVPSHIQQRLAIRSNDDVSRFFCDFQDQLNLNEKFLVKERGGHYSIDDSFKILSPLIAIPTGEKNEFVCPPDHLQVAESYLKNTDHVIAVGWRGNEPHFLELMEKNFGGKRPTLTVINNTEENVEEVITNLKPNKWSKINPITGGFSNFVNRGSKYFDSLMTSPSS